MRKITDHIVDGDSANHQLQITVMDEPGQGGACHEYAVNWEPKETSANSVTIKALLVSFQNGPIKEFGVNGVTHEALLAILIHRLRSFQAGPFPCQDNETALEGCCLALNALKDRTRARIARGVEGTHQK